jgi:hypothetical protein
VLNLRAPNAQAKTGWMTALTSQLAALQTHVTRSASSIGSSRDLNNNQVDESDDEDNTSSTQGGAAINTQFVAYPAPTEAQLQQAAVSTGNPDTDPVIACGTLQKRGQV